MSKWKGWEKVEEGEEVPYAFVLNADIARSKALASKSHPKKHQININTFQNEVEKILSAKLFYKDKWSGDGLVVLYKHPDANADTLIQSTMSIIDLIRDWNKNKYFAESVGLRIGLAVGTIIFQKRIGGIISHVMNKAGLFQKSCPGIGGILMSDGAYGFIEDEALKDKFKPSRFMMGEELRSVYYCPQNEMEVVPPLITGKGVTKSIELDKLFDGNARFSELDAYLKGIEEQVRDVPEVILTGKAPTWLYLHAAFHLKGKKERLFYQDGQRNLFEIFDHSLR